ncbi:hypothetical protein ABZ801_33235 [Actinomadura sp. NPDC047616]|uniref:hypothetical protein n=1 Tax=Actinomadura sp. NPDC047616 TaxID=3155914 RepID=UPI0033D296B7
MHGEDHWLLQGGPGSVAVTGRGDSGAGRGLVQRAVPVVPAGHRRGGGGRGPLPADIATVYNLPGVITDAPVPVTRDGDGRWIGGSVGQWAEELTGAVLGHGAAGFVYFPARRHAA